MIDMGSDCSVIRESLAQALKLNILPADRLLSAFNSTISLPIGCSEIGILIDVIPFEIDIYVVANDQLSRDILIGRNILDFSDVRAIIGATELTIVKLESGGENADPYRVNVIDVENRRKIRAEDISCPNFDNQNRNPIEVMLMDITDNEWIRAAQSQDPDIEVVRKILESGEIQPDTKQYFDKYDLKGGVVFRRTETGAKWLVPRASRFNVVKMCHDDQGHFATDKTLDKIREHYWFKGMRKFVTKYVRACLNCLYYKSTSGHKPGFLHPIEKVAIPFHTLHLDHLGPFIRIKRRNTQILTIVDGFTKFCVLEPVRDTRTKWVIQALDQLFALFGVPTRIITDRGSCFTLHRFAAFCGEYGIKHILNAVATPRAHGQ